MTEATASSSGRAARAVSGVALVWAIALSGIIAARYRGNIPGVAEAHRFLDRLGVAEGVRNLDFWVWFVAGALLGVAVGGVFARRRWSLRGLGLQPGPVWRALVVSLIAAVPMFVWAGFIALERGGTALEPLATVKAVVCAPVFEEFVFRGVLVVWCLHLLQGSGGTNRGGRGFWTLAVASSCVFGLVHAPWTAAALLASWQVVLVTGIGGLWYAWLWSRLGLGIWLGVFLHAWMNLAWGIAGAGDAAGGLWPNIARAGTITIATVYAVRAGRAPRTTS